MAIRKFLALLISLGFALSGWAQSPLTQTLQINTRFSSIIGKPTWLLIIRDVDTGIVLPYMFDMKNNQDFWVAFTFGRNYRVTVSNLKFGPYAVINDFCHLEDGILSGKSMIITLSGVLSPNPGSFNCHVLRYNSNAFPIATTP